MEIRAPETAATLEATWVEMESLSLSLAGTVNKMIYDGTFVTIDVSAPSTFSAQTKIMQNNNQLFATNIGVVNARRVSVDFMEAWMETSGSFKLCCKNMIQDTLNIDSS